MRVAVWIVRVWCYHPKVSHGILTICVKHYSTSIHIFDLIDERPPQANNLYRACTSIRLYKRACAYSWGQKLLIIWEKTSSPKPQLIHAYQQWRLTIHLRLVNLFGCCSKTELKACTYVTAFGNPPIIDPLCLKRYEVFVPLHSREVLCNDTLTLTNVNFDTKPV